MFLNLLPSKAGVNASVPVRNEATGAVSTTTTYGTGRFSVSDVAPGSYAVEVFVPGFGSLPPQTTPLPSLFMQP